ncbi:MAG: GntR family transcriptional regulator [Pseudomonadota bacterium]
MQKLGAISQARSTPFKKGAHVSANGVYERIKIRLVNHEFLEGKRIVIDQLADQYFVSATPVREALLRLAAEGFVLDIPNSGFFAKPSSLQELMDLYDVLELTLKWSLSEAARSRHALGPLKPPALSDGFAFEPDLKASDATRLSETLILHISRQSGNDEIIRTVANVNDRSYYSRLKDHEAFRDSEGVIPALFDAYSALDFPQTASALSSYFTGLRARLPNLFRYFAQSAERTAQ